MSIDTADKISMDTPGIPQPPQPFMNTPGIPQAPSSNISIDMITPSSSQTPQGVSEPQSNIVIPNYSGLTPLPVEAPATAPVDAPAPAP